MSVEIWPEELLKMDDRTLEAAEKYDKKVRHQQWLDSEECETGKFVDTSEDILRIASLDMSNTLFKKGVTNEYAI